MTTHPAPTTPEPNRDTHQQLPTFWLHPVRRERRRALTDAVERYNEAELTDDRAGIAAALAQLVAVARDTAEEYGITLADPA